MIARLVEERVFKDPVHDYILVTHRLIEDLIGTPALQRLRRIKQLGTTYLTYHGAEHSRFSHSLGAYELMRRTLAILEQSGAEWPHANDRDRLLAMTAALLHDLGHGPFSHAMEAVLGVSHERWTARILLEDPAVYRLLASVDDTFPEDVLAVLQHTGYPLLSSLVSSQLDVDRMDYLLRDAQNTGVIYGNFEHERLMRSLTPVDDELVVRERGLGTAEQYVLARYFMYSQVYYHKVSRGAEMLLQKILSRARTLEGEGGPASLLPSHLAPGGLRPLLQKPPQTLAVEEYLRTDDAQVLSALSEWAARSKDPILADLSSRFLNRRLFKRLASDLRADLLLELSGLLKPHWPNYFAVDDHTNASYDYYRVGIKTLHRGEIREISELSDLVRALRPKEHVQVFFARDILDGEGHQETRREMERILAEGEPTSRHGPEGRRAPA